MAHMSNSRPGGQIRPVMELSSARMLDLALWYMANTTKIMALHLFIVRDWYENFHINLYLARNHLFLMLYLFFVFTFLFSVIEGKASAENS